MLETRSMTWNSKCSRYNFGVIKNSILVSIQSLVAKEATNEYKKMTKSNEYLFINEFNFSKTIRLILIIRFALIH